MWSKTLTKIHKEKVTSMRISILLGSILLMAAMLSAQTVQRVTVTVPFSFVAGNHNLPAGNYTIELNHEKDRMVLHSTDDNITPVVMLASNSEQPGKQDQTHVVFQRYGAHYFLSEVWKQGAGQTLSPGKLQRELASKRATEEMAIVELRPSSR
jgi:hypothetical protein